MHTNHINSFFTKSIFKQFNGITIRMTSTFRLFILLMLSCAYATAQTKFNIKGTVIDGETNESVEGASVQLLSLPDSAFVQGIAADRQGAFALNGVKKAHYSLKVTFIGYMPVFLNVNLNNKKGKQIDLGNIRMGSDDRLLKEAVVSAAAAKVQVSGDSLVFNTAAYRVPEGSTLEALLKLLPGAEVDENGKITINGKEVTKILLNGKEFFLNDMETAMKNIPVDMIANIKAYERKSDMARITGIDDGEEETVLDLSVKKDMNNGWFGNVKLGGGTEHRYNSRAMINRFNETTKVSLIGNARNTPNRWGWNNGLRSDKRIGMNITDTREKLTSEGSVMFNHNGSDVLNESSTEYLVRKEGKYGEQRGFNYQSNIGVNANAKFEWKPDTMTNVLFRPEFKYTRNRGRGNSRSASYNTNPNNITADALDYNESAIDNIMAGTTMSADSVLDMLMATMKTASINRNQSLGKSTEAKMELQYNRKFNNKGRNLTIRFIGNYNENGYESMSAANVYQRVEEEGSNTVKHTNTHNNRYYNTPETNYNIRMMVSYNEPIADRTYLQFMYSYRYGYNKSDQQAYVYDSDAFQDLHDAIATNRYDIGSVLNAMENLQHTLRDTTALCKFAEYRNYNQIISLQFRRVRENYNINAGVDVFPQHTVLNYRYMDKSFPDTKRSVVNISPRANMKWNFDKQTNLRIRYQGRTQQPSMTNLLDIVDDSSPLYKTSGNSELKPAFTHTVNVNFNSYKPEPQRGMWFWGNFNMTQNSISNKTIYYGDGSQLTMPMNIDGNWNTGAGAGINTGIGAKKLFNAGGHFGMGYNHRVGFYNDKDHADEDLKSITGSTWLNTGLSTSFRNEIVYAELKGDFSLNHTSNNITEVTNPDIYRFSYGATFQWNMPWGTQIASDIKMNSRRGYSDENLNTNELVWNASISQSFLQGKALTLKAEMFDILHRQTNISRQETAFERTDSQNNSIYQYALVSAIFRFSVYGGRNTMGTDKERRE